ncbi:type 4b pilus protein PilO2 [Thioalkalivibrio sp. ALE19]|uniref:type 4b pilus protein PilO2 n=1 Tax=Thioalkalivibrio sp. ALE19 TaxID=1266909 RepID=UPI00042A326C|nr:type 4b pilus protein PilO2 [Thioalkalivibrio sp. ALE19]
MEKVKLNGEVYLAGLQWQAAPDEGISAASVMKLASDLGGKASVYAESRSEEHEVFVGIGLAGEGDGSRDASQSLASAIASHLGDHVVVARIGEDRFWLLIAHNGGVIPGTDVCGSSSEIIRSLRNNVDLFADFPLLVSEPGLFEQDEGIALLEDVRDWLAEAEVRDLESLVQGGAAKAPLVHLADPAASRKRKVLAAGVAIAVIGVAGSWYWYAQQTPDIPGQPVVEEEEEDPVEVAREEYLSQLVSTLDGYLPKSNDWVLPLLEQAMEDHARSAVGWGFEGLVCDPGGCQVSWVPYSSVRPVQAFPEKVGLSRDRIQVNGDVTNITAHIENPEDVDHREMTRPGLDDLRDGRAIRDEWWDFQQLAQIRLPGLQFEHAGEPSLVREPDDLVPRDVVRVEEGSIHVRGSNRDQLKELLTEIDGTEIRATEVTYSPGGAVGMGSAAQWRVELQYVAQR